MLKFIFTGKRIKDGLITFFSIALSALIVLVSTPEWAYLVTDVYTWIKALGVPTSVITVLGIFIALVWKGFLNYRIAEKRGEPVLGSRYTNEYY